MSKVWLITGSSRGLGRALADAVLAAGDRVVATSRNPADLRDLVDRHGDHVRAVALDVTDPVAAQAAVRTAVTEFGRLDVLVNNAGYANSSPFEETPDDDFRAQMETNFHGVVNVTKAALPVLHEQGSGHIVQISSIGGRVGGTPGLAAYQAAKFAVAGFSEVLHNEIAPLGIKVTIVEPGAFRTDWGGSSMRIPPVGPGYEQTVGRMNAYRVDVDGKQPGDPDRAATAIMSLVDAADPPVRLVLGSDALAAARRASAARAEEADAWASVSESTDFTAP
jgi:NAD(P)-dependent dehydrogenase (short-subunit alcohol dehydrogenase family)